MNHFYCKVLLASLGSIILSSCSTTNPSSQASNNRSAATATSSAGQGTAAQGMGNMQGMDHSSMGNMQGMDHSSMGNMQGMDHSSMGNMQGMDHSQTAQGSAGMETDAKPQTGHGMEHAEGGHGASAAGKPGAAAQASRTVNVAALDTMRFDPQTLSVKAGETVRFIVTNKGKLPHEFVVGAPQEQKEHEAMMQKMPGMKHADENAISLAPGETKTLVWQFGQGGVVELACHVPGHYPAGMVSKVFVGRDQAGK